MAGEIGKSKVFRSMAELREYFFPKQFKKEQEKKKIETILDETKYDKPNYKRRLPKEQDQELVREMIEEMGL